MSDLNRAMIIGRLGRDPEIRYTPDGRAVANFSLATTDKWRDKQSGEMRERTEWHRVVAFGRLGEICGEYLSRGKQIFIEGRLRTRSWEKDGVTRYTTEIEATNMQMLGNRGDSMDSGRGGSYAGRDNSSRYSNDGGNPQDYSNGGGNPQGYSNGGGNPQGYSNGGPAGNFSNAERQSGNVPDQGYPEPTYNETPDDDIPF